MDYRELGLTVGVEIHQRLRTHKLFCRCPSEMRSEEPDLWVLRRLRVSYSELGSIDPAARFESLRARVFRYGSFWDTTCEVELDESPPLPMNREALEIALEVALMLRMEPVDEVHTMRKIVIDGSNTTGFQRTALVALGGPESVLETRWGPVGVATLCLEEESAYIIESSPSGASYRLDRLGIPLVEIATEADIWHPDQAREAALKIGRILRATGRVQRGIGSIRQDINISIEGGARQEIKGVQELALIPEVVRREVIRQLSLLRIREEMRSRGLSERDFEREPVDVTHHLSRSRSRVVRSALSSGCSALAVLAPGMEGLLGSEVQPGRRFGTELASYAKVFGGVSGILHSDELPGYGISREEVAAVRDALGAEPGDAFILVLAVPERGRLALGAVLERMKAALSGVPEETRRALPDGNTEFMRPLPGPARMYPETDIFPCETSPIVEAILERGLPKMPEEVVGELISKYGLGEDLAWMLFDEGRAGLFEEMVSRAPGVSPRFLASILTSTLKALRREGARVERLEEIHFLKVAECLGSGLLAKEAVPEILARLSEDPEADVEAIARSLSISREELERIVREKVEELRSLILERGERAFGPVMGAVMSEVRGRADGALVSRLVREAISEVLRSSSPESRS